MFNLINFLQFNKKIIILCLLLILPFVILEIWAVNRLSTLGIEINKINATTASLKLENQILENEVAKRESLTKIEKDAKSLGFIRVQTIQSLNPSNLALSQ